jgi:8-oxo-dGTP pyrophosphatase MutT (NUDIX family)
MLLSLYPLLDLYLRVNLPDKYEMAPLSAKRRRRERAHALQETLLPFVAQAARYNSLTPRSVITSPFIQRNIVSYGLAVQACDTKRWLLVRPSMTPNFNMLLRGFYRIGDIDSMIEHCAPDERNLLVSWGPDPPAGAFASLYQSRIGALKTSTGGEWTPAFVFAYSRFMSLYSVIRYWLLNAPASIERLTWTWPKGRRDALEEHPLLTAQREFEEETGLCVGDVTVLDTTEPVRAAYRSNNGRIYETQLWIATLPCEVEPPKSTGKCGEVFERAWLSRDQVHAHLTSEPHAGGMFQSSQLGLFHDVLRRKDRFEN